MTKDTYPLPGRSAAFMRAALTNSNSSEFGANRAESEERIFRQAHHYSVVRFRAGGGSEITTTHSFPHALQIALLTDEEHRYLIYAVTERGEAFCMAPSDYPKFALLYTQLRKGASA